MRKTFAAGLAALIAASAGATEARAQGQDTLTRDIRCLIILSNAKLAPEQQAAVGMTQAYLFGRMDAGSGDTDWVPKVVVQAKAMEGKDVSAEQQACGAFLTKKGRDMVERGERLQRLGEEMDKAKP